MTVSKSILDGVGELVDEWLQLDFDASQPLYRHKTAALELDKRREIAPSGEFLESAYRKIDSNWLSAAEDGRYSPSSENWRFVPRSHISKNNTSPEVRLERAIIQAGDEDWVNQVPTSSGLTGPTSDRTRNVDLVHRSGNTHFELIELKVESNNPLFAAIEILLYGLLLAWSRNNQQKLAYAPSKQPVLLAESISLDVLAPTHYYEGLNLSNLSGSINGGTTSCQNILGIPYTFRFTRFDDGFDLEGSPTQLLKNTVDRIPLWCD